MLTAEPLVSVIITCYNQQAFIGQAIESVLSQTYQKWECWIIDDGSNDSSPAICLSYAEKDSRIKLLRQQNAGVSSARNNGFLKSDGRYIQFLDGDDWILPTKFERQVQFMEANRQYSVCYTNHQHYWQSTESFAQYQFELLQEHPLDQFLMGYDRGVSIPIHTALLCKDIWKDGELPFPEDYTYRYEDWVFWVCIAIKNVRFHFLDQSLAIYRMHRNNFISSAEDKAFNSIQATFYISQLIPLTSKEEFVNSRLRYILSGFSVPGELSSVKHHRIRNLALQSVYILKRIGIRWRRRIFRKQ